MIMECEYRDKLMQKCGGKLRLIDKYKQENDLIEVYQCEKCGGRIGVTREGEGKTISHEIRIDLFDTKMTVSQAVEKGKEFVEAVDIAKTINHFIFAQTDNRTSKQIAFILSEM